MSDKSSVGERIKRARLAKDLTLKEVERKAKVSATHISEIERGLTSPTVGALSRIASALDTTPSRLFESDRRPRMKVVRSGERIVLTESGNGGRFLPLGGGVRGADMSLFIIELDAGAGARPLTRDGEEFYHVLRGIVELKVGAGDGRGDILKEGDSVHARGVDGRTIRNIGDGPAQVLWAIAPPLSL